MASNKNVREIDEIAARYAELVKKELQVNSIYLFGSYAAGHAHDDSDIDIAVITDDNCEDMIENMMKLMKLRRQVDIRIEPHPLRTNDPFVKEILATGRKIG